MLIKKQPIFILFVTLFIVMSGFGIIIPVMPFLAREIGATAFQIGMLMASYSLMQFIFSPIWGEISDKIGRKPVILIGLAGFSASFILFGVSRDIPMLFISRLLGGILSSACLPTAMAFIGDVTDEHERGSGMGIMGAAMGLGMVFGPVLGGLFGGSEFSHPFFIAAILGLLTLPFALFFLPESLKKAQRPQKRVNHFEHIKSLSELMMILYGLVFIMSFALASLQGTFPLFSADKFKFGPHEMGIMFGIMGLVGVLVQGIIIGRLIEAFGEHQIVRLGFLLTIIGSMLVLTSHSIWDLTIYLIIIGVGNGFLTPSLSSLVSKESSFGQGAAMGLLNSFMSLGRVAGPLAGGFLYGFRSDIPYYASAFFLLIGLAGSIFFLEPSA